MSTALYRRYRPETFADVIGQEQVTEPLMQALRTGRVNHAYLFSGPRGCGKTTSARILARCLNCEQGPTPEPCGECDSCVALARGGAGTVDVIEIDAASHGGVDDARDLRERASFGPAQSRYKIYIIDEAHMVTPQGFNALLKIVEEPPEHVKFIFATTEPEKVIGTIRSRTHHYPFRLVPPARLQDYLEHLCEREGVRVEPGVLSFVVRSGGGSVRDSLSVLDQLIAGSGPEGLTYEGASSLLGFTDVELLDAVVTAFGAGDAGAVFRHLHDVIETGLDPRRFVEDLLERLRDLIVVLAAPEGARAILRGLPEDQVERMRTQAAAFGGASLTRAASIVNEGLTEMSGATSPRLQLELIAARVLLPGAAGESGYAARLDRLERRMDVGGVPTQAKGDAPSPVAAAVPPAPEPERAPQQEAAPQPRPEPQRAPEPQRQTDRQQTERRPEPQRQPEPQHQPEQRREPERPAGARDTAPAAAAAPPVAAPQASDTPTPGTIDVEALRRSWPDVLGRIYQMRRATWTFLSEHGQVLTYDGRRLVIGISTVGLANAFRAGSHADVVRQALIDALGVEAMVEGIPTPEGSPPVQATPPPSSGGSGLGPAPTPAPARAAERAAGQDPAPSRAPSADLGVPSSAPVTDGRPDWSSAPADPSSAPSWATSDPFGPGGGAPAPARDDSPAPDPTSGASSSLGVEAREEVSEAAHAPRPPLRRGALDEYGVSEDDEDIVEAGDAGPAVVERILGGTVIREDQA
ncbi:DNA polymerase III subunit gamma and tau [Janibacter melonis]|uniref:DNA polymerase III subunit gamma and tau n=1 Tax=Janibacter melonis TaxID=262209 RepID=UPI00177FA930|nr:DNA polymerase III subunit gamma and tau [Janibacter melonis]